MRSTVWILAALLPGFATAAEGVRLGSDPMVVQGELADVLITPDGGRVLAFGAFERTVHVWDARTGRGVGLLDPDLESPVQAIGATQDGAQLLVGWEDGLVVFDAATLAVRKQVDLGGRSVRDLALLPDGRVLVSTERAAILVFDPTTWTQVGAFGAGAAYTDVVASDDGRYLAACAGASAVIWRVEDGTEEVRHMFDAGDRCAGVGFAAGKNDLWGMSGGGQRWLWSATSGAESVAVLGHGRIATYLRTPGSPVGLAATDKGVVTLDARDAHVVRNGGVAPVPFRASSTTDGTVVAVSTGPSSFALVSPTTGTVAVTAPPGHAGPVRGFGWGGAVLFTGAADGKVMSWVTREGRRTATLDFEGGPISDLATSSADLVIVAAEAGVMLTPTKGGTLWFSDGRWTAVAITRDGARAAAGAENGNVAIVDGTTGASRGLKLTSAVNRVAFSPDAKRLAVTTAANHLVVIDVATVAVVYDGALDRPRNGYVVGVGWSPDGKWIWTSGASGVVTRWSPGSAPLQDAMRVDGAVTDLGVTPGGRVVLGTDHGQVLVLDTSGAVLTELTGHRARITRVSVSPDGHQVASADTDGVVLVHPLP
jgi:WD40 repeat protein